MAGLHDHLEDVGDFIIGKMPGTSHYSEEHGKDVITIWKMAGTLSFERCLGLHYDLEEDGGDFIII